MAAALLALVAGVWIVAQATAGRLPARLLSWRSQLTEDLANQQPAGGGFGSGLGGVAGDMFTPATPGGAVLSACQVAQAALSVGLPASAAVTAVAIAKRESGYNTQAHNPVPPDDSYGLWQINRLAHPQYTPAELKTAAGNARAMYAISSGGTNWRPWTTWTGSHVTGLDLQEAKAAVAQALAGGCR
jgi:hypothetical protein